MDEGIMGRLPMVAALVFAAAGTFGFSPGTWSEETQAEEKETPAAEEGTAEKDTDDRESKVLFDWHAGRLRLELAGLTGVHSGRRDRTDDYGIRGTVEYEIPLVKHLTVGGRVMPLFFWNENTAGDNDIFAFGVGPTIRAYSNGEEFRGWFGEIGIMVIGQTSRFEGNSGAFNFLSEAGAGYMFKKGWHASAKIQHISNAGLASNNSGVNGVGMAFGYTFKPDGSLLGRH